MKDYPIIRKTEGQVRAANFDISSGFSTPIDWSNELSRRIVRNNGLLNIASEAIDRHLQSPEASLRVALRFVGKRWPQDPGAIRDYSYQDLHKMSVRFARALISIGLQKGDCVFALSPRIPELYFVVLGTLRAGAIFSPLFSAFGPEPIAARMIKGQGKVLFTLASLYRKKVASVRSDLTSLKHVIVIDDDGSAAQIPGAIVFESLIDGVEETSFCEKTTSEDLALLHFTSGTTGKPKAAAHAHAAVIYHEISGRIALDLKSSDLFWCTADPGWVTGISYGIISPLANGATLLVDEDEFKAPRWYQILQGFKVTNWYTAPTAMRMLMKAGEDLPKRYDLSSVRLASSVGEPLNPEVIQWAAKHLKVDLHDNWWQSETGGIVISNYLSMNIKPGSMGKPLPGMDVRLASRAPSGEVNFLDGCDIDGEIVIRKTWPSMFRDYLGDPERYTKCFSGDWYFSGDLAHRDEDGYFWFVGRVDDVIKSSGHLVGPFEVESALMEHPAVLESGVIGKPDPVAGEIVKAFIVLKAGFSQSEDLLLDILAHARKQLGVAVAPREISFIETLPKTRSGKIMRRLLKARELGLPEGDTSTLEASN